MPALPPVEVIDSLAALRAIGDPQRHRILSLLIEAPLAAGEVATRLRMPRTKVYYHLKLLAQTGFISVVEDRVVGRRVESVYRAKARSFRVDAGLIGSGGKVGAAVKALRTNVLESALEDLRAQPARGRSERREVLVARKFVRLTPPELARLRARLVELFDGLDASRREGKRIELAIALFPLAEAEE